MESTAVGSRLGRLERLANEAGAEQLAGEAHALSERVRDGLFYVACIGQFKRGKSTLINALLGSQVLPTGVAPVTAVVTVVRHGAQPATRVRFVGGGWRPVSAGDLAKYVTEEQNPENERGVVAVEVFAPAELLATGMCLVDTPGIGSVFAGNTEATRDFVPHVDAGLVVLGADPPISADELALVTDVAAQCDELLFVLNKTDKLGDAELEEADGFTRRVLAERASLREPCLLHVSATERLAGQGPARGWRDLEVALATLARRSGSDLVQVAKERGIASLADRLRQHLDEQRGALLRPVEESEQRVEALRACTFEAERALGDLDYLFAAEQDRLARTFADTRIRFLEDTLQSAGEELVAACREHRARRGPRLRRASIELARQVAGRHLDAWLVEAEPMAEDLYVRAMDRFVDISNDFLEQLKASSGSMLANLPTRVSPETGFRWDSRLFYTDLFQTTGEGPFTWIVDLFRTRASSLSAVERGASDYLIRLFEMNATRIENDLNERVLESRRRFAFELRSLLRDLLGSATQSLDRARGVHARGSTAVEAEVERISALGDRLTACVA